MSAHQLAPREDQYMKPDEAAAFLRMKASTLAHWRSAGTGPAFVKIGSSVFYLEDDLRKFIAAARREPSAA